MRNAMSGADFRNMLNPAWIDAEYARGSSCGIGRRELLWWMYLTQQHFTREKRNVPKSSQKPQLVEVNFADLA
jgi:hypothetical protein